MTVEVLSQLRYWRGERRYDAARLAEIDRWLTVAPAAFKIPLEELRTIIAEKHRRCVRERNRLARFIAGIRDPYIQRLFAAHFAEGKTWVRIAIAQGGFVSEETLKKSCYRYLERHQTCEK